MSRRSTRVDRIRIGKGRKPALSLSDRKVLHQAEYATRFDAMPEYNWEAICDTLALDAEEREYFMAVKVGRVHRSELANVLGPRWHPAYCARVAKRVSRKLASGKSSGRTSADFRGWSASSCNPVIQDPDSRYGAYRLVHIPDVWISEIERFRKFNVTGPSVCPVRSSTVHSFRLPAPQPRTFGAGSSDELQPTNADKEKTRATWNQL
jgi:hypothetical protein